MNDLLNTNKQLINKDITLDRLLELTKIKMQTDQTNSIAYTRIDKAISETLIKDFSKLPIKGVPILLKNLGHQLKGEHNSSSNLLMKDYISGHTDNIVTKLIDSGFTIVGQTNTPEFGFKNLTNSFMYGTTTNGLNRLYHAGGSSGGAASAVSSGIVSIALASDGGGSIRIPSSYQGLIGLKPSRGRITSGPFSHRGWQGASVNFAITKSINDTIFMLDLLSEYIEVSPYSIPKLELDYTKQVENLAGTKLKIAYSLNSPVGNPLTKDAKDAVLDMVNKLSSLGHTLVEDEPNYDGIKLMESYYIMNAGEANNLITSMKPNATFNDMEPLSYLLYQTGFKVNATSYIRALEYWDSVSIITNEFHNEYDLFLQPTTNGPAPLLTDEYGLDKYLPQIKKAHELNVNEQLQLIWDVFEVSLYKTPFTQLANLTGQPAISLPTHMAANKMPVGTQFMAKIGREDLLLYIGSILEHNNLI